MSRVYFKWMNAYWSISPENWAELNRLAWEERKPFDLDKQGARELKSRPRGHVEEWTDTERRHND